MDTLPSSIETYFQEAGFSATEILIIKKLVEGEAMTLRDLAFKTGKSTGVLDQAMKKLLKKKIVLREMINGTPKYVLHSLDAVIKWLEGDTESKKRTLEMRHHNFESFIASISAGKKRPEMQFFQGEEGVKKAYMLLLEKGNDFVQYGPTIFTESEDPLREFRVQYFRERRKRNIFLRVITHNSPLGRRAISRDPFEYRKTILVDENIYPFSFEKIIVGNTVACFHLESQEACFIQYPELAEKERQFFEKLWNLKIEKPDEGTEVSPVAVPALPPAIVIPTKTRILSEVREFFLSRKSIVALAICALLSAGLTYFLYEQNVSLDLKRIQERVKSIVTTGASQFNYNDIAEIQSSEDVQKPVYSKLVYLLNEIRKQNHEVEYAYILRPTEQRRIWEFVADADYFNPYKLKDLNSDGKVNNLDQITSPGRKYDINLLDGNSSNEVLTAPVVIGNSLDKWDNLISGLAPIKNSGGETIAILGIDIFANRLQIFFSQSFIPIYYFTLFFVLFILIRLAAFNKSLFKEIINNVKSKYIFKIICIGIFTFGIIYYAISLYTFAIIREQTAKRIMAIATTAASEISYTDLDKIHFSQDMKTPEYQRVFSLLNQIKNENQEITYVYILRPTQEVGVWEFVVDADSNYYLPEFYNYNDPSSKLSEDENVWPGVNYNTEYFSEYMFKEGLLYPTYERSFVTDKWGTFITGSSPIRDSNGNAVAVLAIDVNLSEL